MIHTHAELSSCQTYRYTLERRWSDAPMLGWMMVNPSTADASVDDPTICKCMGYARRDGYGGILVLNLFAYRTPDPKFLKAVVDPVGSLNDMYYKSFASHGVSTVVCAWGRNGTLHGRDLIVRAYLRALGLRMVCLLVNKDGTPAHPLYQPNAAEFLPYTATA